MANLFIIVLEIVIGLISAYLLYYVHQKGTNQANKEDLEDLTRIVEEVKLKNSKEVESIKANLSLLTDRGKQIFSEEKDSIIVFFTQLNTWIWESLNINFNAIKLEDISKRLIEMQDAYNKTNVAYSKVKLIINDSNLVDAGQEAITRTYDVHILRKTLLNQLYLKCRNQNTIRESIVEYNNNEEIQSIPIGKLYAIFNNYETKKNALISNKSRANALLFNIAMEAVDNFKDSAQTYIRK